MTTEIDNDGIEPDLQENAVESVGELLKSEREIQGYSEKQVADRLHITMHYVRAIEADSFEKLPGTVFARGYIKSYAELLGLDRDRLVELFDSVAGVQRRGTRENRQPARRGRNRNRVIPWLLVAMLAFASGFLVFWVYTEFFAPPDGAATGFRSPVEPSPVSTEIAAPTPPTPEFHGMSGPTDKKLRPDNTTGLLVGL